VLTEGTWSPRGPCCMGSASVRTLLSDGAYR
jgi:hypothetical protein